MDNLEQQQYDGERASYALQYLAPKFDKIERDLAELLWDVSMHDQQTKDELLRSIKNLRRLRTAIQADIDNGELAKQLVARSVKDRLKSVVGI